MNITVIRRRPCPRDLEVYVKSMERNCEDIAGGPSQSLLSPCFPKFPFARGRSKTLTHKGQQRQAIVKYRDDTWGSMICQQIFFRHISYTKLLSKKQMMTKLSSRSEARD